MGGVESRFYSLLLSGSSDEALQMWLSNPEDLQELFHPNVPIKSSPFRDNPLHCAARHGMKILMHEFLEKGADPYARNDNGETAMHIVCRTARGSSRTSRRQKELLSVLLDKIFELPLEDSYDVVPDAGLPYEKAESDRLIETWPVLRNSPLYQEDSKQEDKLYLGIQDKVSMLPHKPHSLCRGGKDRLCRKIIHTLPLSLQRVWLVRLLSVMEHRNSVTSLVLGLRKLYPE